MYTRIGRPHYLIRRELMADGVRFLGSHGRRRYWFEDGPEAWRFATEASARAVANYVLSAGEPFEIELVVEQPEL